MRFVILIIGALALLLLVAVVLPSKPWMDKRRKEAEDEPYDPRRQIDPSDPPPVIPEPEDDVGPGDRDVPPGSRRDRQRHGRR